MATGLGSIQPASLADVPAMARISKDSFVEDRHTQMKGLGKVPYDMEKVFSSALPHFLNAPHQVVRKAVDKDTGEIMGWIAWGFRGFTPEEMARISGKSPETEKEIEASTQVSTEPESNVSKEQATRATAGGEGGPNGKHDASGDDSISRLEAMTDADMKHWMEKLMPEGARCMYVVSLAVAPKWQSRGVGSALMQWGTAQADAAGVFAWVHSSEHAWQMYSKHGFEVVGTLDVDLDEYAPGPPPVELGGDGKWGHYVFRYMKRLPAD
ncbi:acyl-CoA N-acyltransferase [Lipomyces kononenkoae]|uniref:Acyl-CoA N-acyltransferase n=1 Tax=Lipomyces kononenkoae TaxID=34357 RepID=A0ACC3SXC1_LIPKO